MTILVTGGLGYIGSHTVVELLQNNFEVVIIDDLSNTEKFILKNIEEIAGKKPIFYPFDLKRKELLKQVFDAHKIEGCIHFAAYKAVGESQVKPIDYYENNLFSLINLLQEMKERNISNFIFSSSCTVYGQADTMPIDENTPLKLPESSYGKTKQMGEEILKDFATARQKKERIIAENEHFVLLVPFWATWPYETMIISKRHFSSIAEITEEEIKSYAEMIQIITVKYDNLFKTSFPYSAGIHQAPTDGLDHEEWHFHMHFYPPLLRSATVKKFMVGYELLAEAQRDLTAEQSAEILRNLSTQHYKH